MKPARATALRTVAGVLDSAARAIELTPWWSIGSALSAMRSRKQLLDVRDELRRRADAIDPPPRPVVRGVVAAIVETETEHRADDIIVIGGDPAHPSWDEYLGQFSEGARRDILEIRAAIEHHGWIGRCGDEPEVDGAVFVCTSGRRWVFSKRAWGDLMQAIIDRREGYVAYAWHYS